MPLNLVKAARRSRTCHLRCGTPALCQLSYGRVEKARPRIETENYGALPLSYRADLSRAVADGT